MDTHDKIREIRAEFKEYLIEKNPEWSESTVNTHLSDYCIIPFGIFIDGSTSTNQKNYFLNIT